eukprot:TRINITY_DN28877_c0_g1_i1.p1 TRINITY_DN28877_c0_g1~~TRINITY_DN28877_c0_g1_i1.p1  ORF type:complete len:549 (+),score=67.73 TRINITY_DN28877_c0_g1_i1:213-1859(+)
MVESFWKVKDGLWIGDQTCANSRDLIEENQVSKVVNCAGFSIPNLWRSLGVAYLTYDWVDEDDQLILDRDDVVINEIFRCIEDGSNRGESTVVFSVNGQSRSCCVVVAYLMKKFTWCLQKSLDFLSSRRPGHKIKVGFMRQLSDYEGRLTAILDRPLSREWDDEPHGGEEAVLRSTHINSQRALWDEDLYSTSSRGMRPCDRELEGSSWMPSKLTWLDNMTDRHMLLEKPSGVDRHNIENCQKDEQGRMILRPVLKVGGCSDPCLLVESDFGRGLSTASSALESRSIIPLCSGITCVTSPTFAMTQNAARQRRSPTPPRSSRSVKNTEKGAGFKVFRFLLGFEPLALAIEWGVDHSSGTESSLDQSLPTSPSSLSGVCLSSDSDKTLTRIEFSHEELVDVRARASLVVAEQPFLSFRHLRPVEVLLGRLASRTLPVYEIIHLRGAVLYDEYQRRALSGDSLPYGALVLARERVRELDGWWIRIWSGQWFQATRSQCGGVGDEEVVAERCQPSTFEVRRWLQDAAASRDLLIIRNANVVAEQVGLKVQR